MWNGIAIGIGRSSFAGSFAGSYATRVTADGGVVEALSCLNYIPNPLDNASLLIIPSGYKGGVAYAELPANGNGDLTWTRGSDGFRTNASGVLQRVPWNLVQYSEQFNNAFHFPFNLNAFGSGSVANTTATVDPNGLNFADYIQENTSASVQHSIIDIFSGNVSGTTYTWSVFAKAAQRTIIQLANNGGGGGQANYNLTTGVASLSTGVSASMQDVGNGWYRCILSYTSTTTGNHNVQIRLCDASGNSTYTGNGTSGVYIWGAQLVEGTTAQTYLPTTDRLNFPRLDYTYGSCPALLLEPQRTNLVLYSQQFDNASWGKTASSVTANSTTSPSGVVDADTLTADGTSSRHDTFFAPSVTSGTNYTYSVYAKKGTNDFLQLSTGGGFGSNAFANFDLNTGVIGTIGSAATATITALGNGWYRCTITAPATITGLTGIYNLIVTSSTASRLESNTLTTSVFLWGAQLEAGAYPTTYIPTTNATATRLADSCSKTGISSLIGQTQGTIYLDTKYSSVGTTSSGRWFKVFGTSNEIALAINGANAIRSIINGQSDTITTAPLTDTGLKIAWAYNASGVVLFVNGVQYALPNGGAEVMSSLDSILFDASVNAFFAEGTISQAALFKTRLSNTELASLTTL